VEKAVLDARHGLWYHTPPLKSLQELNSCLQERCQLRQPRDQPTRLSGAAGYCRRGAGCYRAYPGVQS